MKPIFDNEVMWKKFDNELRSWLNTPYRHLAGVKGRGADCTLFVAHSLLAIGVLTEVEHDYYSRDWHIHTKEEFVRESIHRHIVNHLRKGAGCMEFDNDEPVMRGDMLCYATTTQNVSNHCGIVLDEYDGRCHLTIHSIQGRGVSYFPLGRTWKRKQRGGFRFMEV